MRAKQYKLGDVKEGQKIPLQLTAAEILVVEEFMEGYEGTE